MKKKITIYINELFKSLVELHEFQKIGELEEGQSYMVEYSSSNFVIKIEKYFREFYVSLYKVNKHEYEINLFNLLEYLRQGHAPFTKSNYFHNEKDIDECYRKQIEHISTIIYENYNLINNFFIENDYELNVLKFEKYWRNKHPEFYKR